MERILSVSLGEIALKGKNRKYFEDKLIGKIQKSIRDLGYEKIKKDQGKIYIWHNIDNECEIIERLKKVFGLVYISPCYKIEKEDSVIDETVRLMVGEKLDSEDVTTFKIETNRVDKTYRLKSPEMSRHLGGVVLKAYGESLSVDVHQPDFRVFVDIKEDVYVYIDRFKGYGGLPIGTNGKGLVLLSGGIDSPVAAFMMAKRGVEVSAVHFHSYPFTSERAEEKVKDLAKILTYYTGKIRMFSVNILEIQKSINKNCPAEEMTIQSRRFMMRIADKIAEKYNIDALITGENLGQVASQTMKSMSVINQTVPRPILRPLVGFDKNDIIEIARDIETYETSILPFDDCCTLFLPDKPLTQPKLRNILSSEENLDIEELVDRAIENMEISVID